MQDSDNHLNIPDLIREFKTIDKLHREIRKDFSLATHAIIHQFYPRFQNNTALADALVQYASNMINATGSVIDKDLHYPEYRLKEELDTMHSLLKKRNRIKNNPFFFEDIHNNTKRIMVKYFPAIVNLSGNGFRLLEANALMYGLDFDLEFSSTLDPKGL